MILSPDPALLNEDPFANGARLIFVSIPKSTLVVPDSEAFFDANIQPFLNTPDADLTQPTEYLTIDGQNAYSAAVNGTNLLGERMIWHSTVIEGEFILILALAEVSEEHAERLDEAKEIISSIEFLTILR